MKIKPFPLLKKYVVPKNYLIAKVDCFILQSNDCYHTLNNQSKRRNV